jgi:hypothetical protein
VRLYVDARDDEPPGAPTRHPICIWIMGQPYTCLRWTTMRPLRLSLATGIRFLSRLWHESANGRVSGLRAKGGSGLESMCILRIAARRSTGTTGASLTSARTPFNLRYPLL